MPRPDILWDGTGAHAAAIVAVLRADGYAACYRPAIDGNPPRLIVLDPATGVTSSIPRQPQTTNQEGPTT